MPDERDDQVYALSDLEIDTVGLVGKAANKRRFLLWKSEQSKEQGGIMPEETKVENLDQVAEAIDKAETVEDVKGLFAKVIDFFKGIAPQENPDPEPDPEPVVAKAEDPRVADLIKAQEEFKAELEKARAEIEQAQAMALEERQKRELAEHVAKASDLALPIDVQKTAELLQWIGKADPGQAAVLENVLKSASEAFVHSGIYYEMGTQRVPVTSSLTPFEEQIEALTKKLRDDDPNLSKEEAEVRAQRQVRKEHPELARQWLAKRQRETGGK